MSYGPFSDDDNKSILYGEVMCELPNYYPFSQLVFMFVYLDLHAATGGVLKVCGHWTLLLIEKYMFALRSRSKVGKHVVLKLCRTQIHGSLLHIILFSILFTMWNVLSLICQDLTTESEKSGDSLVSQLKDDEQRWLTDTKDSQTHMKVQMQNTSEWSNNMSADLQEHTVDVEKFLSDELRKDVPTGKVETSSI